MASRNLCVLSLMLICKICTAALKTDAIGLGQKLKDYLPGLGHSRKQAGVALFHQYEDCHLHAYSGHSHIKDTLLEDEHIGNLSLQFTAFGQRFLLDLHLTKDLFSSRYTRKLFQRDKDHINKVLHRKEHCYYQGIIRDNPKSHAAISSCDGFSGYISDGDEVYHIQPLSGTSLHRIFRNKDRKKLPLHCGTDVHDVYNPPADVFRDHARRKRSINGPYDANKYTRFVELYLVNDYRTYSKQGKNATSVFRRSQEIANIVNSLYRQLNIYVVLAGVEVWGTGDKISIKSSADATMENFLRYRKERINPYHSNDNAQLITGIFFDHGVVGKAIKGPICTHQFSGGVSMDYDGLVTLVATTVAHEMGHNFGMEHDNDTKCSCPEDKCIMAATSGQISPHHWSSCSQNALHEAFELGMDYCLRNAPKTIFQGPVCGNGFVEEGEGCDCGLPKDCTNRCCNATTCQLYAQAQCGTGRCCDLDTCKPKVPSTLCREPVGECDLPEFCDGANEFCPPDVYLENGVDCGDGQSYCYKGKCNTHNAQCRLLWGSTGRVSDPICFQQLNVRGDHDGNCRYNWTTDKYHMCDRENVMCGLLHCVHLNEKLMFWRDNLALDMRANFLTRGNTQYVCRSTMLDVGLDMPDPGFVPDGAKCEENKICLNRVCTPLMKLNIPACADCNGNGICNSKGHCHCHVGYAPPLCDRPGYGGSIDSGPATNEYAKRDLLIGLLVLFLVILPLVALTFLAYINRSRLIAWWAKGPGIKFGALKKSQCTSAWPPQPRPSAGFTEKRWSAAPGKASTNLEISGPLMEDEHRPEPTGPPKPLPPSRPIFTPPAAKPSVPHPKYKPPAVHQNQTTSTASHLPAVTIAGQERKSFMGATIVSNPLSAMDNRPACTVVTASSGEAPRPPKLFPTESAHSDANAKIQNVENTKPVVKRTVSPPVSPTKAGRKITHSQSMREAGDMSALQPGDKIVKRESFRGTEISNPILVSTTNRDSQVFADFEFDDSGTLTRTSNSVHRSNPSADTDRDGCRSPVRRSQSDRPLSPKRRTAADGQGSLGRKNKAFRPRPLPPEPVLESEPLYINEGLSDLTDLKACITSAFDGINMNLPSDNVSVDSSRPAPGSRMPASSASGGTSVKTAGSLSSNPKQSGPSKPLQTSNLKKEAASATFVAPGGGTNKGTTLNASKNTASSVSSWNKGPADGSGKAPLTSASSTGSSTAAGKGQTAASAAPASASTINKPAQNQPSKGPSTKTDLPVTSLSSILNKGLAAGPTKNPTAKQASSASVLNKGQTTGPGKGLASDTDKPISSAAGLLNKGSTAGLTTSATKPSSLSQPPAASSKSSVAGSAARGPLASALNKQLAAGLENKGPAKSSDSKGPAASAAGRGTTSTAASRPATGAQNKGPAASSISKGPVLGSSNKTPAAGGAGQTGNATNKGLGAASAAPSLAAGRGSSSQLQKTGSGAARPTVAPKPQPNKSVRSYNF